MKPSLNSIDDKLLYKLIVQFMIYSQGKNQALDPHIVSIRKHLKQGASLASLKPELSILSHAIEQILSQQDSALSPQKELNGFEKEPCIKRLNELLDSINIPNKFQSHCKILQKKLITEQDDYAFSKLLASAFLLMIEINQHAKGEQHETEQFLEAISNQLSLLDQQTQSASASNLACLSKRESLNADIHNQIDHIKNSTSTALELNGLQRNISMHVQELSAKLHTLKEDEDQRLSETQKQLADMSHRLQNLEEESNTLKNNLKLAHAKAFRDSLTGVPNRLAYNEKIEMEFKYWKRYKKKLTLVVWDIDHFKQINDQFGHKAGDKTLALVAQLLQKNCRETDFVARYGGEEFVMLLHEVNAEQSLIITEKTRQIIAQSEFKHHDQQVHVTLSCGISELMEGDTRHEDAFERADNALYQSKQNGRNRCTVYH